MDTLLLEDTTQNRITQETEKLNVLIAKLEKILKKNGKQEELLLLSQILTANKNLETYTSLLSVGETRAKPVKKFAVSATPVKTTSLEINKVPKTPRTGDLIKKSLVDNEFLRHLDNNQLDEIVECMFEVKSNKDDVIITEGEVGVRVYVLQDGIVQVSQNGKEISTLESGSVFGELAVLFNCIRTVSIKALTGCRLWALDRETFQQIMKKTGEDRLNKRMEFLRSVPEVRRLPLEARSEIANVLEEIHYERGDYIVRQGTYGDTFFIISKGEVVVTKNIENSAEEENIKYLQKNDFFGERALENEDEVRTANVVVSDSKGVDCLCIDRETYQRLLRKVIVDDDDYEDDVVSKSPNNVPSIIADDRFTDVLLNDLTVMNTLGVGGMGKVKLVQSIKDGKKYALKKMRKRLICEKGNLEHIKAERNLLLEIDSEFIVKFYRTFKDIQCIYLMMEACLGGELWTVLKDKKCFEDKAARFYVACAVEALYYLHERGIVYRDLKPENIVLEDNGPRKGYAKLIDFGCAKKIGHTKTWTFCGTPEYVAPEIIRNKGHDTSVDLWSIGVLIYELLNGTPPFCSEEPIQVYNMILRGVDNFGFPRKINKSARDIIKKFCRDVPTDRLGYGKRGNRDIQKHRWYSGFNWDGLKKGTLIAPIHPPGLDLRMDPGFASEEEDNDEDTVTWDLDF